MWQAVYCNRKSMVDCILQNTYGRRMTKKKDCGKTYATTVTLGKAVYNRWIIAVNRIVQKNYVRPYIIKETLWKTGYSQNKHTIKETLL